MTSPLYAPWIKIPEQGWRPIPLGGRGRFAILSPPGLYTVKLSIGEKEFSQKLTVKKDPNSTGTENDIQAQTKLLTEIRNDVNAVVDMINQLEWMRKQMIDLNARLKPDKGAESIKAAGKALDGKLISLESNLCQLAATGRGQDSTYLKSQLLSKLLGFTGIVAEADFPPTTQQLERQGAFKIELDTYRNQFNELLKKDLTAFNGLLKEKNIPILTTAKNP